MKSVLKKYKHFDISLQELKNILGEDLYNVDSITPEKVYAIDIVYAIKQYLSNKISLSEFMEWVNVVWFTELYEYVSDEENAIASVMALLETLDEGVTFTNDEYIKMIKCLETNSECKL